MKEATILKKIEELESERESLFAQKAPIEERLLESYYELEKLYEARDKAILKRNRKEIDIDLILTAEHQSMVMYREAEKQIQKLGLWGGGYYPATGRWDGCKDRYMICRLCLEIRKEFADSWCYGMLWEDIQEECSEDIEIGQIDNLSKEAVSHLENMMGWRWEED